VNAGLVERTAVPRTRVVAEPLEHPLMRAIGAGDEPVEGHHHLENDVSIGHVGTDLPALGDSSHRMATCGLLSALLTSCG